MVVALYVLAGVMVAGGLSAIYSGSDIIVMERGWTMVIAGSVMAASGALLAGIATAVGRLQSLQGEFGRLSERLTRPESPSLALPSDLTAERSARREVRGERIPGERPSAPPLVAVPEFRGHRDLDITPEPILSPAPTPPPAPEAASPPPVSKAPVVEREPVIEPERHVPAFERELEILDRQAPVAPPAPEPEPDLEPEREPEPPPPPAVAVEEPEDPTIVGTYNSGGNFYIMYSDGSIEAETPAGKFRFNSLDELKDFIAAGGDKAKATS